MALAELAPWLFAMPSLIQRNAAGPVGTPRANPDDFGAGQARGMRQVGRTVDRTAQVLNAAMDQRARLAATQYQAEAQNLARELMSDPGNLAERPALFEKQRKRLRSRYAKGPISAQTFDQQVGVIDERLGGILEHETRREGIVQGQAALADTLDALSDERAQAFGDASLEAQIDRKAQAALDSGLDSGLIDDNLARDNLNRYNGRHRRSVIEMLVREDPKSAAELLTQPTPGLDEFQRQALLTRSLNAYAAELKAQRMAEEDAAKALEEAEEEAAEAAEIDLLEKDAAGTLTIFDVTSVATLIESERGRLWLDRARDGGGGGGSGVNAAVYVKLDERARQGLDIRRDAREAYLRGELNKGAYDDLLNDDQRSRFGDARKHLSISLDVSNATFNSNTTRAIAQQRQALALRSFDSYRLNNPGATREEAMGVAEQLVKQGTIADMSDVAAFNLNPATMVRGADGRIDEAASNEALEASGLSEPQKDLEFQALERLVEIEQRQQAVEAN